MASYYIGNDFNIIQKSRKFAVHWNLMTELQSVKQRFGIIGNNEGLNRALDIAVQVAPTDLSVLISGESGTGKEVFPQVIHNFSLRKHGPYIAVNCGAIPEGTIDSELFGHEKGAFTGATDSRKGYFEVANGGTVFLDEVAELPLSTQVRLLRVLESGEFIRVGSSKVQKTDVRVITATNIDIVNAVASGRFREDLFYRLNTVPVRVPPLRERGEDIILLFRKFSVDFAERYRMPAIRPDSQAREMLLNYYWPGNVRQLKNIAEQISVIEQDREVTAVMLTHYLPDFQSGRLPVPVRSTEDKGFSSEREILYKVLFDMKSDMHDLKNLVYEMLSSGGEVNNLTETGARAVRNLFNDNVMQKEAVEPVRPVPVSFGMPRERNDIQDTEEVFEESLSLTDREKELIKKALDKNNGKRKLAAAELGISERTLYRKIKEYGLEA
jgi:transcriptional regulator with PAS, ATPase and Fis domain